MAKDMARRLEALADLLPERPEIAAELRTMAAAVRGQRRAAGMASGQAQSTATGASRARALQVAVSVRRTHADISQARLAESVKQTLGALIPEPDTIRRWLRQWERTGELALKAGNNGVASQPNPAEPGMVAPMEFEA